MIEDREDHPARSGQDFDLAALRQLFARRWRIVAGTVAVVTGVTLAVVTLLPTKYEAAVPLLLAGPVPPVGSSPASTIRAMATAPVLLEEVRAAVNGAPIDPDDVFVDPVPNTPFVRVRVHDTDPARASVIARQLGERVVAASRQLREDAFKSSTPADRTRLEAAEAELREAERRLIEFRQTSNIELLRRQQEIRLAQQADAIKLDLEIEAERARLNASTDEKRSADDNAEARVAAESRGELAALERRRARTRAARELESKGRKELYERELELKRVEAEYELARTTYITELARVRQLDAPAAPSIPLMEVAERTAPPASPVSRDRLRLTALVLASSFLLGLALVILLELLARPVRTGRRAQVLG